MGCLRPATPGFLCTLIATGLLAVVSFCVPYFKTVYFLKANISVNNVRGSITFGTLGYCLQLSNGTTCSSPTVGYQLDINGLVGNRLPVEIPQVAVKWLTYALVLHIVALVLSAGSALFGLLAHVREMSMTCFSTCVSGFAAAVALLAFIFDVALFFIAKARINAVGSAEIGNALWLTLAAWLLLFFSGCFYTLGRCCISKRSSRTKWDNNKGSDNLPIHNSHGTYAEQMRLDAVKAEADRKANQKTEVGLPAFYETQPLTGRVDGDSVYVDGPYQDHTPSPGGAAYGAGRPGGHQPAGYVQGAPGSRAVDEYYNPTQTNTYPPQPHRQASNHTMAPSVHAPSVHAPSNYGGGYGAYPNRTASPPLSNPYLSASNNQYPDRQANMTPGREYGHTAGGTSYHSAVSHPTGYSQYDSYDQQPQQPQSNVYNDPYAAPQGYNTHTYYSGDGYGANTLPPLAEDSGSRTNSSFYSHPSPIQTNITPQPVGRTSPIKGPRSPHQTNEDSPPGYDAGSSGVQGAWGKH